MCNFTLKQDFFYYFLTHNRFNNHLKHLGRETRLGVLIMQTGVALTPLPSSIQVTTGPFDREPSLLVPTRPQLSPFNGNFLKRSPEISPPALFIKLTNYAFLLDVDDVIKDNITLNLMAQIKKIG